MLMEFIIIISAIAAIIAAVASVKALFPKAKPNINDGEIFWPEVGKRLTGNITVANNGPKTCTIESIQMKAVGYNIETYDPTDKLLRSIRGYEIETVSFKCTVEPTRGSKVDTKKSPKNITIETKFNCKKKPIPKILNRIDNSYKYT